MPSLNPNYTSGTHTIISFSIDTAVDFIDSSILFCKLGTWTTSSNSLSPSDPLLYYQLLLVWGS